MTHCPGHPEFDFHSYMMRALEDDFKKVVGISWYLWLFVVIFLLLNIKGWHTYFWLSFLPLLLLLIVGAKLEHIITRLAQEVAEKVKDETHEAPGVRPSDEHFWFQRPRIVLYLIHFILFQNSFEIAFFFWIWGAHTGALQLQYSPFVCHRHSDGRHVQSSDIQGVHADIPAGLGRRGAAEKERIQSAFSVGTLSSETQGAECFFPGGSGSEEEDATGILRNFS